MKGNLKLFAKLTMGVALFAATVSMAAGEARAAFTGTGADYQSPNYVNLTNFGDTLQPYANLQTGGNADFSYVTKSGSTQYDFTIADVGTSTITMYEPQSGTHDTVVGGALNINIKVNPDGTGGWAVSSGTATNDLSISATSVNGTSYTGTLLTGTYKNFQISQNVSVGGGQYTDNLEFYFTVTGGSMASLFGGNGATVGLYFSTDASGVPDAPNLFGAAYSDTELQLDGGGYLAEEIVTPIPPSILMFLPGLIGLGLLRRFKRA